MVTLKELREKNCMTQDEVREKIGMKSPSNYSKIENRKQKPRMETRRELANLFNVKVWEIEF
jgi:transcriptional regulator with XRE-family HTH domain